MKKKITAHTVVKISLTTSCIALVAAAIFSELHSELGACIAASVFMVTLAIGACAAVDDI